MTASPPAGRGGIWVVAQFVLMGAIVALAAFGPEYSPGDGLLRVAGVVVLIEGAVLAGVAMKTMRRSLTPYPRPRDSGELVTSGLFAYVRHPIYTGVLVVFLGICLIGGPFCFTLWFALLALWIGKLRVEEQHLRQRFPDYEAYAERVRWRLLPGVY